MGMLMYDNLLIMAFISFHLSEHHNIKRAPVGAVNEHHAILRITVKCCSFESASKL